ncbi:hypothetical protein U3A55_12145 [Salarchaeum sp. III]|uniref:DUF7119 family protein n=1 Tax=Salarchaeum sp. III TaxID=3107927 RepID=UPI002ED82D8C
MTETPDDLPPTDRESPVGEPVIRGDERVVGDHAANAVSFDPDDPERVAAAVDAVRGFANGDLGDDHLAMLRGAAACAALVRSEQSYKAAAERAGDDVTVPFVRKWARVHDLPQPVRRHVALGHIPPTAAKHIARVGGDARYRLAWAVLDNDLTVRQVRQVASDVNDGRSLDDALRDHGVTPGELTLTLPPDAYRDLRRRAAMTDTDTGTIVANALDAYLDD